MMRLVSALVLALALPGAILQDNLVTNPGFEKVDDSEAKDWFHGGVAEGGKFSMALSKDKPKSGKYCMCVKGDAEWATVVCKRIPVEKGKTYLLTGFVRVTKGSGYIKFDYFKDGEYQDMTMGEMSDSADWTEQSLETEADKLSAATHITATLVGSGGEFEAYFDDIVVKVK